MPILTWHHCDLFSPLHRTILRTAFSVSVAGVAVRKILCYVALPRSPHRRWRHHRVPSCCRPDSPCRLGRHLSVGPQNPLIAYAIVRRGSSQMCRASPGWNERLFQRRNCDESSMLDDCWKRSSREAPGIMSPVHITFIPKTLIFHCLARLLSCCLWGPSTDILTYIPTDPIGINVNPVPTIKNKSRCVWLALNRESGIILMLCSSSSIYLTCRYVGSLNRWL